MSLARDIILTARPQQWIKNLFVLAPLFFGKSFTNPSLLASSLAAMAVFCCLSSAVYFFNDLADAEKDRAHPVKRKRAIAAGRIGRPAATFLAGLLAALALATAGLLSGRLLLVAGIYLALNLGYSLGLKRQAVLDVMCVSAGFLLRVLAGGAATGIHLSHWLIVCTITLSLLIALGKRRTEAVAQAGGNGETREVLQKYSLSFLDQAMGIMTAVTLLAYLLYVTSPDTTAIFGTRLVMLTAGFVIYGALRYLNLVHTHGQGEDPTQLVIKDRPLQITCLGWLLCWGVFLYLR